MRQKILDIIKNNPKTYSVLLKKDTKIHDWVNSHTLSNSSHFPTKLYSAIYQVSDVCEQGNVKKFTRWSSGFSNCGPAAKCECTRQQISNNVSVSKLGMSSEKNKEINAKREETMLAKYGHKYNSQRSDIKDIWKKPKIKQDIHDKLTNFDWMEREYITKKRTAVDIASELGVYYSTVIDYCSRHGFDIRKTSNYSMIEIGISNYIQSLGMEVENNIRLDSNKEIDILVPAKGVGFEVNGLYWHSCPDKHGDKNRHLQKINEANSAGISLVHVTDWEWNNKQDIIKSMIAVKLGRANKIYARKTTIVEVNPKDARIFLSNNHLQGPCNSSLYYGLIKDGNLVMVMSFGKDRFKSGHMELHRMASAHGTVVVGGASKLLAHFRKYNTSPLVSYCDIDKSSGNVYKELGFKLIRQTAPGYFWTDGNNIFSRYMCQKKKLVKWLSNFDASKSEAENMFSNGYRRYWTSGNYVFELEGTK